MVFRTPATLPFVTVLIAGLLLSIATIMTRTEKTERSVTNRPIEVPEDGYISSDTCRACHPWQYETWHESFHRTMTQVATRETVRANFDEVVVEHVHGRPMKLERHRDEFWAEFDDPTAKIGPAGARPRIRRQVVMITGSHHQQIYWYATGHDRALNVLPGVYLIAEERWASRSAVTLHPPNQRLAMLDGHWNAICSSCHTTFPKTRFDTPFQARPVVEQSVDTTVAEFGIACEACHGPSYSHVQANTNPLRRYQLHLSGSPDLTTVLPTRLDPKRSSQICGQCHSVWEFQDADGERFANDNGLPYRPGDDLRKTRFLPQPMVDSGSAALHAFIRQDPEFVTGSFWSDGMIRVSGREYNGLIDSPCYQRGRDHDRTLSCFSCHTMHKTPEDPRSVTDWAENHQVSAGMHGNDACGHCHVDLVNNVTAHTRHASGSSGSSCYNCHMPYTSYGLLKVLRSHTISSPSARESVETGRPNACNLCHLDKTLAWTDQTLRAWFSTSQTELTEEERFISAALLWLIKGDAGQRAITAWNLGWQPAQEASGTSWMFPHLAELLNDPYEAVRFVSYRSLRSLPGYANLQYDFLADREDRISSVVPAIRAWRNTTQATLRRDPELLVNVDGTLKLDTMRRLLEQRDNRRLFLRE